MVRICFAAIAGAFVTASHEPSSLIQMVVDSDGDLKVMDTASAEETQGAASELSTSVGDMCGHPTWDYSKICREQDGKRNKNGECNCNGCYWDFGTDKSKPVHTGCTPKDADEGFCKPAGGEGISQIAPTGYKGCCENPTGMNYEIALGSYAWIPPCETKGRACMAQCVNRVNHQAYMKTYANGLGTWKYTYGMKTQHPRCKKPARNCNYNDHARDKFYKDAKLGRNCKPSFDVSIFDKCAENPEDEQNCLVKGEDGEGNEKMWNVLSTCWDEVWGKVCEKDTCFMLKGTNGACVSTCETYEGGAATRSYEDCQEAYAEHNCPMPRDPTPAVPSGVSGWGDSPPPHVYVRGCGAKQECGGRARKKWCKIVKEDTCGGGDIPPSGGAPLPRPEPATTTMTTTTTTRAAEPAPEPASEPKHDPSACRENGEIDDDCCAKSPEAGCANGYALRLSGTYCSKSKRWGSFENYECIPGLD